MMFEWDEEKNHSNFTKHWIRFDEVQEIWTDQAAIEFCDTENSISEERFVRIGYSSIRGILTVVYCERENGSVFRIISARRATRKERDAYERRI